MAVDACQAIGDPFTLQEGVKKERAAAREHATATIEEKESTKEGAQAQGAESKSSKNPSQVNSGPDSIPPAPLYLCHSDRYVPHKPH